MFRYIMLFALGCSAAGSNDPLPAVHHQELALNVPDSLRYSFELATTRWDQAHGIRSSISEEGIPVYDWGFIFYDEEVNAVFQSDPQLKRKQLCGATLKTLSDDGSLVTRAIYISTHPTSGCSVNDSTTHELGHVWGPDEGHADEGIMASAKASGYNHQISDSTLSWVCSKLECLKFNPE